MSADEWNRLIYGNSSAKKTIPKLARRLKSVDTILYTIDLISRIWHFFHLESYLPLTQQDGVVRQLRKVINKSFNVLAELERIPAKSNILFPHMRLLTNTAQMRSNTSSYVKSRSARTGTSPKKPL